jgi:hypothetical protein
MNPVQTAIDRFANDIARFSRSLGREVSIDRRFIADRSGTMTLETPGEWSANRTCRLLPAAGGWLAVNLPRPSDLAGTDLDADPWTVVERAVRLRTRADLLRQAHLLGLAVAGVCEAKTYGPATVQHTMCSSPKMPRSLHPKVIDISSLWAGPLCGGILASMGASVLKVESRGRPDSVRTASPAMFRRLNERKSHASIDLDDPVQLRELGARIAAADVLITSARRRAFQQLGLAPHILFAANPQLIWVAITGYGWTGAGADRIGFGDDAAAAGGLVRWTPAQQPRFIGDALADPLTGLAAAVASLVALMEGGGMLLRGGTSIAAIVYCKPASRWPEAPMSPMEGSIPGRPCARRSAGRRSQGFLWELQKPSLPDRLSICS